MFLFEVRLCELLAHGDPNTTRAVSSLRPFLSTAKNLKMCSDGLECSKRSGGNLHMRCWTPEDIAEQEAGEMGAPPPAPSASTMITPPVPMPTFPVPMPTFPAMTGAIDPNNCAGEGGRAQQCGASANRPPMCCEGFVCTPGNAKVSNGCVAISSMVM